LLIYPSDNPEIPGELGVSVSTPNLGHGPLRVIATDYFVCGTDTVNSPGGLSQCADGSTPRQLIQQRIYQKYGNTMSYYDRWAGSMTYHENHGHMHVDDWGTYSLREEVPGTDPLTWPILAEGAKLGFCLMDYGSCNTYNGHCRDDANNIVTTDAPNYGLGGGNYACGLSNQGISAGWTDIYYYYLDGMQIPIPESMCNGTYKIVVHVDPHNYFLEEDDDNNVMVADITLTEQNGSDDVNIAVNGDATICAGEVVQLTASGGSSYQWSTGETGQTITVSEAGTYSVQAGTDCGMVDAEPVEVNVLEAQAPVANGDTVCEANSITLTASATGTVYWYDAATGGNMLSTGDTYTTPPLTSNTNYYVANEQIFGGGITNSGLTDHVESSQYSGNQYNSYLIFDVFSQFNLKSVKVYTDTEGPRTIELRDENGTVLQNKTVTVPLGQSRIDLDFDIMPGTNYHLSTNGASNQSNFGHQSPRFQRNDDGVSMPYEVAGVVSIKDTEFGTDYYYYFYDWEVQEQESTCTSLREEVVVIVDPCLGIEDLKDISMLNTYPNPTNGEFEIFFEVANKHNIELEIMNATGQVLITEKYENFSGQYQKQFDFSQNPKGVYFIKLLADGLPLNQRIVVQ
jgi:hypothetical protein